MLTFDNRHQSDTGELPKVGVTADVIEVGENDAVWFRVRRFKCQLEVVDKTNGKVLKTADIDSNFAVVGRSYGMGPRQIGAAVAALRLDRARHFTERK